MMKRTLIVIFMAVMAVPVVASPCWACSCASSGDRDADRRAQAKSADLIFTGIAKNVWEEANTDEYYGDEQRFTRFEVGRTYKGHPGNWVTILNGQTGDTCGYHFEEGERYTVFAYEHKDRFHTNICSGTKKGRINPDNYGLD